jgi:hypothetical protein
MGSNLAPGVEITERSFSQRIESGALTSFATMGLFTKGPVNEVVTVSSEDELREVFGKPDEVSFPFFGPIAVMLDEAPVNVIRIEDSEKFVSGVTVAVSGGELTTLETPAQVKAFPATYDSLFTPDEDSVTQIELPDGVQNNFTFVAVGPGTLYNEVNVAVVNNVDYNFLREMQTSLADADTPTEVQEIGETTYNTAVSGSGLSVSLAGELIDPTNSYDVDTELLEAYLAFENGPSTADEFGMYEFEGDSLVSADLVSVDPDKRDINNKSMFANKVIGDSSTNIKMFVSTSRGTAAGVTVTSFARTNLSGSSDLSTSISGLTDEFYQQMNDNYLNKEDIAFSALIDLDFPTAVKQRMAEIASIRKDCMAILNVPSDKMINVNTGKKNSKATTLVKAYVDTELKVNSTYAAIYANYFKIYDSFNDVDMWVPCTGHVANRMAYTFENFERWFAFAGLERGIISGVLKVAFNPDDAKRKVLYPARINCIVDFRGEGVVIWGNKTLQSFASSTDRVNVRNLFIHIATEVEVFSRSTLFKQNDEFSRAEWRASVGPFLNTILQRRGISDYRVICDATNNPEEVVARNEFQAYLLIKPTPVAEFIKVLIADVGGTLTFDEVLSGVTQN